MQWPNSAEISLYSIEEIVFVGTEAMRDKDYVSKSISIWEFEHLSIYINAYYVQTSGHFQSGVETARSGENKLLTKKKARAWHRKRLPLECVLLILRIWEKLRECVHVCQYCVHNSMLSHTIEQHPSSGTVVVCVVMFCYVPLFLLPAAAQNHKLKYQKLVGMRLNTCKIS